VSAPGCPNCGEANPAGARLCGMCGTPLTQDEAAGEVHREVTLVTSDLKGSTALGERLDPEALREVLNRYFTVMRAVFESHGGTIEKIIGDAIVAVFGLPFRRDDDALRAVEAAAESQRALVTLNDELEQGWGVRLVNRTGVATGEVTFGKAEGGQHVLLGEPVEVSTVMEQNAPALEVLMAESTLDAVREHVEFDTIGQVSPKGSDERFQAYRLVSVHARQIDEDDIAPEAAPGMRICPSCGEQNPERMRLCVVCGASLTTVAARESRRTVTIVFAMPKVHAASGEEPADTTMRDVMSRYFDAMRDALERHGGTVEKFIGDAVMAVFGLPVRHEDDALRAIRAAVDMQSGLDALNVQFRSNSGLELSNHIGVNSGEVIAGDASTAQRLVTGDAVNTAARLEQAAEGGQIVLGPLTYRLARDQIEVEFIEPLTLKGKAEPVPAYRLVRLAAQTDLGHVTPFVGREAELARLTTTLDDAVSSRRARLAAVVGDAGVGKSRLIREFATQASERARLIRGRCLPYGDGITFWPLAEAIREAAGITSEDSPRVAIRRIDRVLDRAGVADREAVVERVAAAINLSAAQFPVAELMWGGRRLLEALASERPLVLLVDDLHWAESTFLDFLDYLLESVESASLLVLGSSRHEITERHADWTEAHRSMLVLLEPLNERDAGRIVEELLGSLEMSVRARIAGAAEGNPLYVEQIVSMLVETGAIERGPDGWVAKAGSDHLQIPPTVQALVASRLDALRSEERAVVDPASVIGLTFALDAVTELVDEDVRPGLGGDLDVLITKQLVRRLEDEEILYRFGHQIIRDTAYGSLLKRVRAALHERFVSWAERINRERGRELEFEEILGYHLETAYHYRTELGVVDAEDRSIAARAAAKLSSAGRRALARTDMPAAANLLERATTLLTELDPQRVELLLELAEARGELGDLDAAAAAVQKALDAAHAIGDERLLARGLLARVLIRVYDPSLIPADEDDDQVVVGKAIATLEGVEDHAGLARGWRVLTMLSSRAGRYDDASRAAERVIEHASAAGEDRLVARGASGYAIQAVWSSQSVGALGGRIEKYLQAVHGDRKAEANISLGLAQVYAMQGEFERARELYRRGQMLLRDLGPSISAVTTSIAAARVESLAGDFAAAEAELRRDEADLAQLDERYYRPSIAGALARVLVLEGKNEEAEHYARVAREVADPEDTDPQVLWRSVRARVLAQRGEIEEALELSQQAVELTQDTEDVILKADTLVDRSAVLAMSSEPELAGPPLEAALELFVQKGDVVSAERVRREIDVGASVA
jgi:class 3 adenylate cyclase/tetratricopeptide (TPR) repeat protein